MLAVPLLHQLPLQLCFMVADEQPVCTDDSRMLVVTHVWHRSRQWLADQVGCGECGAIVSPQCNTAVR